MAEFQFNADPTRKKAKAAFLAVASLLFIGLGYLVYVDMTELGEIQGRIDATRIRLDKAIADVNTTAAAENQVLRLREVVLEYVKILPNEKDINGFVDQLTQFAQATGVQVTKLDDADARARVVRGKRGAVDAFDRVVYRLSLDGFSEQVLRFMDAFENYDRFVRISSLKIESRGERVRRVNSEDGGDVGPEGGVDRRPAHDVDLELETYVYNPRVRAEIPNEEVKLEKLRAVDPIVVDARRDLALATYKREPRENRRDILLDPRARSEQNRKTGDAERKAQQAAFDALADLLAAVRVSAEAESGETSIVKRLKAADATEAALAAFEAAFTESERAKTIVLDDLRKRIAEEIEPAYAALADGRGAASRRSAMAARHAEEAVQRVRAAFDSRRFDEVVALEADLRRRRTGSEDARSAALLDEAAALAATAAAEIDFDGRLFEFGGTVVFRGDAARSVAIINGRPYMPGDRIDEETKVAVITATEITFEFRGRPVVRAVRSGPSASDQGKKPAKTDRKKKG